MSNKAKATIIDINTQEEVVIPCPLSIEVIEMLIENAINSGFKVIVDPIKTEEKM